MASKKKRADTTSGSEDEEAKVEIKEKAKKAKTSATGGSKPDEDNEPSWPLDKKRFVKVREFKGKVMIDLREYYEADGEMKPGRKGISLSLQQWKKLVEISKEVDEVLKKIAMSDVLKEVGEARVVKKNQRIVKTSQPAAF